MKNTYLKPHRQEHILVVFRRFVDILSLKLTTFRTFLLQEANDDITTRGSTQEVQSVQILCIADSRIGIYCPVILNSIGSIIMMSSI